MFKAIHQHAPVLMQPPQAQPMSQYPPQQYGQQQYDEQPQQYGGQYSQPEQVSYMRLGCMLQSGDVRFCPADALIDTCLLCLYGTDWTFGHRQAFWVVILRAMSML